MFIEKIRLSVLPAALAMGLMMLPSLANAASTQAPQPDFNLDRFNSNVAGAIAANANAITTAGLYNPFSTGGAPSNVGFWENTPKQ